jgi:hypothetical protein
VFNLSDIQAIERIVTQRAATRRPYVLEPALAGLAAAWAKITGNAPYEPGEATPRAAAPYGREDFEDSEDEDSEDEDSEDEAPLPYGGGYDSGALAAKVAAARTAAAAGPDIPPIPPGMEAHAAAQLAERQRQFREQYADIALPEADQAALRTMIGRPGGISTRAAASSLPWSHTHVHRQLMRWRSEGTAEVLGEGSARRWHAATAGAAPVSWPPLRALPDPAEDRAEGDLP